MSIRLNRVLSAVLVSATCLALAACGSSKPGSMGDVSHPDFIGFGPGVHGLTGKVKEKKLRLCLSGITANSEDWNTWEKNIQQAVLKWVDAIRPIAHAELTSSVKVVEGSETCDGEVRVTPGTWSNTSIGEYPVVNMDYSGYFASANVLLHEFGHAFGLADTYWGGQSGNCQEGQPQAVMCNTSFDTPQPDDIAGIQEVYKDAFPQD